MKCPVCKTELNNNQTICPNCSFNDIRTEFINAEEAVAWMDNVVVPFRTEYQSKVSANELFERMFADQWSKSISTNSTTQNDFQFEYTEKGIKLTGYNASNPIVQIPSVINGQSVVCIGENLFKGRKEIKEIVIPNTVSQIENSAFEKCSVEKVVLPDSIEQIGESAFSGSNITEIVFPPKVRRISSYVCGACRSLRTVVILGAEILGNRAFFWCDKLEKIFLPNTLRLIDCGLDGVDVQTTRLNKIIIPASVEEIRTDGAWKHKNVAVLNDNVEWKLTRQNSYVYQTPTMYCNMGSTTYDYANKHSMAIMPLSSFPSNV